MSFTIPQLLQAVAIGPYVPQAAEALNAALQRAVQAVSEVDYVAAVHDATKELFFGDTYFPELPKFMPVTFQQTGDIKEDLILESAITSVRNTKNIVLTEIQGRDGTIKEFINNGDYQVTIKGTFAFKGMDWPRDNVKLFHQYMKVGTSIKVTNDLLKALEIYEIVLTDWDMPESGFINIIPFTIQAISDTPAEYKLKES